MPIYEYKCSECGAHFEKMQKVSDEPLTVCEVCGGNLEKQWSLSGFQFKGAGWYVTDYSNKSKESAGKPLKTESAEKTEKSPAAESTTAKTDSASNSTSETSGSKKETTAGKD